MPLTSKYLPIFVNASAVSEAAADSALSPRAAWHRASSLPPGKGEMETVNEPPAHCTTTLPSPLDLEALLWLKPSASEAFEVEASK